MFHPKLMINHFETFIKMTDKENVKRILKDFLSTNAYVGFTQGFDIQKLTQTMRRIYKSPGEIEEISTVLDFCLILALSNSAFEEFDSKSKTFVEECLQHIDNYYQGFKSLTREI
jgi:hypothetical protein